MPQLKTHIIQPLYSADYSRSDELFQWELEALDKCDSSMDLIVLPEATDVPAFASTVDDFHESYKKYNKVIIEKAATTAKRCHSMLFINALFETKDGLRNTTYAFDRDGNIAGYYFKEHPTNGEVFKRKLDSAYSYEYTSPTVIEMEDIRFCFLTCYDFYFYENYANIARLYPDVIIGCSHQRTDTHSALEIMCQFLAYNTNSYVVRSSVSMGEDSDVGGGSMVVAPDGTVLVNMKSEIGASTCTIDPTVKYYKPAGYGNPPSAHHEYIEVGRRPWKYRPAGSAIVLPDNLMPYPRLCAHRGFNTVAPENTMPAWGAAVALGASEIEFDLWETADGNIVSIHDKKLDRVSNGTGFVWEYTLEELRQYDFGKGHDGAFSGLRITTFEEILQKFSCHVIMNIHIKSKDNINELNEDFLKKIISLIHQYDCKKYVYFMSGNDAVLQQLKYLAPDIARCVGAGNDAEHVVERAIKFNCQKVQFFKPKHISKEKIDLAHANGIKCNVFWSDDAKEAQEFIDMGVDTVLTNDYQRISSALGIK